jgi:hypothetical protein
VLASDVVMRRHPTTGDAGAAWAFVDREDRRRSWRLFAPPVRGVGSWRGASRSCVVLVPGVVLAFLPGAFGRRRLALAASRAVG